MAAFGSFDGSMVEYEAQKDKCANSKHIFMLFLSVSTPSSVFFFLSWLTVSLLQVQQAENARHSMHQYLTCDVVK